MNLNSAVTVMNIAGNKMNFSISILIIMIIMKTKLLTNAVSRDWIQDLLNDLYKDVDSYQLMIFTSVTFEFKSPLKTQKYPTTIVSLNDPEFINSQFLQKSIHSSLVIFFTANPNEAELMFDLLKKLSPLHPRPKCLMILDKNNFTKSQNFERIFYHAWSRKFLDFTIVTNRVSSQPALLFHYNPFYNVTVSRAYEKNVDIFPNKMSDLNKYPI